MCVHLFLFLFIYLFIFIFIFCDRPPVHCQSADFITQRLHALQGLAGSVPKCFAA